jgi:hypothetical protein
MAVADAEQADLEARVARVGARVAEWQAELDSGAIRDADARYCWRLAAREIRTALAGASGE